MARFTRGLIGAAAVAAMLTGVAADAAAAPRGRGGVASSHRVAQGPARRGYRRGGGRAGPAIAGAALGLIGAATAAAAAGQYRDDRYYGSQSYYGRGPGYYGSGPGYGGGPYGGGYYRGY